MDAKTYCIVRFFQNNSAGREVIETGLTLEEARAHCADPETSWKTAQGQTGRALTETFGPWFDGYEEE